MEHTIDNGTLSVKIHSAGAELFSIFHTGTQLEYMWQRTPPYWPKSSPVLFPIVGALKKNTYTFQDKNYSLPRHGFAREQEFEVEAKGKSSITFILNSSEQSLQKYPFEFQLRIRYDLEDDYLRTTYSVTNTGKDVMLFSIGAHPAFKVPLAPGKKYEDYHLLFNRKETIDRWNISDSGLIETSSTPVLKDNNRINITKNLFDDDALVFKRPLSDVVSIKADQDAHGLDFYFEGFPFLGIWAQPNADFVCIEPWCGIADSVDSNQQLTDKEGIEQIPPGTTWSREWKVRFY